MKILVLGCKGQLGRCLNDQLKNTDHEVIYSSREQIDITDFEQTEKQILKISPDIIINATAYTAVDKAEEDKKSANLINHLALKNIADICNLQGCWLIHVSTDYVFDGNAKVPYKENDQANPQSVYGETKLKGEVAIQGSGCRHIIIRSAWVFSEYGNNFLKTILRLAVAGDSLRVVDDQIGCPCYAQDIAKAIVHILGRLKSEESFCGLYHFAGNISCSWAEFSQYIVDEAVNMKLLSARPKVVAINTDQYPTSAKRPKQSCLNSKKIGVIFGVEPSDSMLGIRLSLNAIKQKNRKTG